MIELLIFLGLIGIGFGAGRWNETRHLRSLAEREAALRDIMVTNLRTLPENWTVTRAELVAANVVIALDYFKTIAASLKSLLGGNLGAFETLTDRARREATVRVLEEARALGANAVWNLRIETAVLGHGDKPSGIELIAYGTAVRAE